MIVHSLFVYIFSHTRLQQVWPPSHRFPFFVFNSQRHGIYQSNQLYSTIEDDWWARFSVPASQLASKRTGLVQVHIKLCPGWPASPTYREGKKKLTLSAAMLRAAVLIISCRWKSRPSVALTRKQKREWEQFKRGKIKKNKNKTHKRL